MPCEVVDGKFIAAAHRIPARIVGDGTHSVQELIEIENRNPKRGRGHENFMTLLSITPVTESILAEKGYSADTVLAADERLYLERTANLSTGGTAKALAAAGLAVTDVGASVVVLNGYAGEHFGWRQYRALGASALDLCAVADGSVEALAREKLLDKPPPLRFCHLYTPGSFVL